MPYTFNKTYVLTVFVLLLAVPPAVCAAAEEGLVSSMSMMMGSADLDGITIRPVPELSGTRYTEDYGPSQVLEIIRPDNAPITLGRLYSSCGCLRVATEKKSYARGERALLEVRNVKPTLPDGATYMLFIQVDEPVAGILQYDIFAKSERR